MISFQGLVPLGRHTIEVQGRDPHFLFGHGAHPVEVRLVLVDPQERVGFPVEGRKVELEAAVAAVLLTVAIRPTTPIPVVPRSVTEVIAAASAESTMSIAVVAAVTAPIATGLQ
jgi:hypothetical protein